MKTENDNKNLNVPNLRFPEFDGEWSFGKLKDIAILSKGSGISKDQLSDYGKPCILYGELYTKYKSEIIKEVVSKTNIDNSGLVQSKANDVIIPCSGEAAIEIATARCVQMDNILLGGDLNVIRLKGHDGGYFAYQLNGKRKIDIAKVAQGVSVVHLYGEHLKRVKVAYPSLREQQKISSFLSLIDERISTQIKIIEDLKKLKSAICKILFEHCDRVSNIRLLGDICKITTGKLDANAMTDDGKYPFFTCAREDYKTDTFAFYGDSLLISGNGEIGIVKRYNGKFNAYQRTYVLQNFSENIEYLMYYIEYHLPKRVLKEKNVGAMPYIVLSTLSEMPIKMPDIKKQFEVNRTLTCLSELIELNSKLKDSYTSQKSYLLAQMFI